MRCYCAGEWFTNTSLQIADLEKALEKELAAEKAKRSSEGDEAPQA